MNNFLIDVIKIKKSRFFGLLFNCIVKKKTLTLAYN